jgi:signal transduction histidine kinase
MDVSAMNLAAGRIPGRHRVLLGIEEPVASHLTSKFEHFSELVSVTVAASLRELQRRSSLKPAVILLDHQLIGDAPIIESVQQLAATAPVIVVAPFERQTEIATLVASGNVDFVARFGDFVPLAASLIERRISAVSVPGALAGSLHSGLPGNLGEIFRHEINNPLTGILGNAELLLAHRDRLPAIDTQRLQTVVDLAVRLRETIRHLSNSWEVKSPKSA